MEEIPLRKKRFSHSVFWGSFLFLGTLFFGLAVFWMYSGKEYTMERQRYLSANLVYDVVQSFDIYFDEKAKSIDLLITSLEEKDVNTSENLINNFLNEYSDFQEIILLDKDFKFIAKDSQKNFLSIIEDDIILSRVKESLALTDKIGNLYWGVNDSINLLVVKQFDDPVYGKTYLSSFIELDSFFKKMISLPSSLHSDLFLVDSYGSLIFHPDLSLVKRNLIYTDFEFFKKAVSDKRIGLFKGNGLRDDYSYFSSFRYEPLGIVITMETPSSIILNWMFLPGFVSIVIFLFVIVYIIWLSSYLYRLFSKRTHYLKEGFARLSEGEYGFQIKSNKQDDFLEIENSFNQLSNNILEKFYNEKEEKEFFKSSERLKSKLIEVVTNRLFVPLKTMKMDIETLLGGALGQFNSATNIFIRLIHRKNSNVISTVEDILLVDEIQSSRFVIKGELTDLHVVTSLVIEELRGLLNSKRLKISLSKPVNQELYIDNYKIKKVVFKLLSNAIKFSDEEGKINITIQKKDNVIMFAISDEGKGMSEVDQQRVFGKFFRSGNISLSHPEASGLSLYIAQKIVEAHKGKIWVESLDGKGSTFIFTLPID